MSKPLVSIIMGAYNAEDTIEKCLDSVISQTYENWEFIICNDCSKDKTWDILSCYEKSENRIVIFKNDYNMRLAASLNKCLKKAKGKYIARMDADDEALPFRLEEQVDYLEKHPEMDCVGSAMTVFDENGDKGIRRCPEYPGKEVLLTNTPFAHPTIMMKKEVYDALGGYVVSKDTMRAEDVDLWIRFFKKGYKGYNIQRTLYRYRESEGDLKKRSFKAALGTTRVFLRGYKTLDFPRIKWIFALKPIISALCPNFIMKKHLVRKLTRE